MVEVTEVTECKFHNANITGQLLINKPTGQPTLVTGGRMYPIHCFFLLPPFLIKFYGWSKWSLSDNCPGESRPFIVFFSPLELELELESELPHSRLGG